MIYSNFTNYRLLEYKHIILISAYIFILFFSYFCFCLLLPIAGCHTFRSECMLSRPHCRSRPRGQRLHGTGRPEFPSTCHRHHISLRNRCAACGNRQPPYPDSSTNSIADRCANDSSSAGAANGSSGVGRILAKRTDRR